MKMKIKFIDVIPKEMKENTIYISLKYNLTEHLCPCGCKNRVVLPIHPDKWNIQYNGETVSIEPSVGNYNLSCSSHYFIRNSEVIWVDSYSSRFNIFSWLFKK